MIKAVFFDVGYTLLHTSAPLADVCSQMLAKHGYAVAPHTVSAAMHTADAEHTARYHALTDDWARHDTIVALWLRYYRRLFDALDIPDPDAAIAHEMIAWYGQPRAWQPFDDVAPTLARLRARGLRLGAVSDWAPSLLGILQGHALTRYFDFVLCSGSIGFCKPSPHFYRLALLRANVAPHQALHIGDSYYADVRGARAVGIRPVLLDRQGTAPAVDCAVVRSLGQLEPLLDQGHE
jgi:putative hydrolase of the HAD superfamily